MDNSMTDRPVVLVIGGAGYVGSHACKALAGAGFDPVVFDDFSTGNRWAVRWGRAIEGDMLDGSAMRRAFDETRPAGVMLFAAASLVGESMREPESYWRRNLVGALETLEASARVGRPPVIFSSTCSVFGVPEGPRITETMPKAPVNPYGATKLAIERLLADVEAAHGQRHAILRYFNAAGADPDGELGETRPIETHLIPLAIEALLGRRPPLEIFGDDYPTPDGTAVRDYVHVSDLADAHVVALRQLLDGAPSMAINLGTGHGRSVKEVLDGLAAIAGVAPPHRFGPRRPGDPPELVGDPTLARERLGFAPDPDASWRAILETAWRWAKHGRVHESLE